MVGQRGPVPVPVTNGNQDLTLDILQQLASQEPIETENAFPQNTQAEIKSALDRLASRSMVQYDTHDSEQVVLTAEAEQIVAEGSHEYKVWQAVKQAGRLSPKDPALSSQSAKQGSGNAIKAGWIKKDGDAFVAVRDEVRDSTQETLEYAQHHKSMPDPKTLKDFAKRKLVSTKKVITYQVRKGPKWATEIPVEVTDLTAEMLEDGSWESANFKPYNFNALGAQQNAGTLHPLNKVREEFRKIFFGWGFTEMPTAR